MNQHGSHRFIRGYVASFDTVSTMTLMLVCRIVSILLHIRWCRSLHRGPINSPLVLILLLNLLHRTHNTIWVLIRVQVLLLNIVRYLIDFNRNFKHFHLVEILLIYMVNIQVFQITILYGHFCYLVLDLLNTAYFSHEFVALNSLVERARSQIP